MMKRQTIGVSNMMVMKRSIWVITLGMLLFVTCVTKQKAEDATATQGKCVAIIRHDLCGEGTEYEFCFHLTHDSTVDRILVTSGSAKSIPSCTLQVSSEVYAVQLDRLYTFQDLDGDGCLDLGIYSSLGVNSKVQYWRYTNGRLAYLGQVPELQRDPSTGHLLGYERGGYAGLEYESNEYVFKGDSLVVCKSLSQKYEKEAGDTAYFILAETGRPLCGTAERRQRIRVYKLDADSTVIDTVR